jgi:LysM repeat protein
MSLQMGRWQSIGAIITSALLLFSCNSISAEDEIALPSAVLVAYESPTALFAAGQNGSGSGQTQVPSFTPTPISYLIVEGDTLLGIAERNALSLDSLLLANPGVDARFLSVGQELFLPIGQNDSDGVEAQTTAVPLNVEDVNCFPSAAGELWCFMLVENQFDNSVENIQGKINLFSGDDEVVDQADAFPLINKLDRGKQLPLMAFWEEGPVNWASASGELVSTFSIDGGSDRYVNLSLIESQIEIIDDGAWAQVSGKIQIMDDIEANLIWVLAVAYDGDGQVVGVRRWEGTSAELNFELQVYSLGSEIEEVDLLVEGRP